ncbi:MULTISPECIES: hypothetical protein [Bradyrhizobium]|uniref:Histidine kinase n=2 Tax=Bradyrhizobium TaxID=374 RepID=A0ABY0PG85_9BRAD|nr:MULTISPECIES: hypothetical protein [Bradyrhizobium]SDI28732.1 hypothetical protein SAMN05444163_2409 [Bradyrhizobium ottawaense]SED67003.1 hypothetical protein SAMN05444171_4757 [Bradyrhizobium lablabi]SHL63372.1 hypothetical protein SAMN05444321_3573 [Bradyrhizobium lablabi]
MADYYPLIARAIAGLDPSAPGESRRALYERARSALIAQLRSVQPPLSESEITRERLSLEEAVRKVESEAAQRARDATRPGGPPRSSSGDAFRRANARPPESGPSSLDSPALRPRPPAPPSRDARPPLGQDDPQRSDRNLRAETPPPRPQPPQLPMQEPVLPPTRERSGAPRRGPDNSAPQMPQPPGMRGFRDIAADADDLGRAAATANRNARKTYANVPSPSPEFDRIEPGMENRGADPEQPYSYDESQEEADRYATQPPQMPPPQQRSRIGLGSDREPKKRTRAPAVFPFKSAIAIGIVLILVGAGILWGRSVLSGVSGLFKSQPTMVEAPKDASAPQSKPKIPDRVGQPSSSDTVAPVAQRVVLYDEDPGDPKGKQYVGSVIWRTEQIKATGNAKPDIAVRADIEIPDRKFKMTMSFRRNTDSSLPASHTAELTFILPQDFTGGGVGNVPGILMKSNEQARGTPLAGLAVKVTDGFFLVGLSNVDADRTRNLQLLKERSWFDVPLVYVNQRRAIIAIEKGAPGERAFNDAFAAWGE